MGESDGERLYSFWRAGMARAHGRRMDSAPAQSREWSDLEEAEREAWQSAAEHLLEGTDV